MAWHRPGGKPLSEAMMVRFLTHILWQEIDYLYSRFWLDYTSVYIWGLSISLPVLNSKACNIGPRYTGNLYYWCFHQRCLEKYDFILTLNMKYHGDSKYLPALRKRDLVLKKKKKLPSDCAIPEEDITVIIFNQHIANIQSDFNHVSSMRFFSENELQYKTSWQTCRDNSLYFSQPPRCQTQNCKSDTETWTSYVGNRQQMNCFFVLRLPLCSMDVIKAWLIFIFLWISFLWNIFPKYRHGTITIVWVNKPTCWWYNCNDKGRNLISYDDVITRTHLLHAPLHMATQHRI